MEEYNVFYSDEAINDLRDIYTYIAFDLKEPITAAKLTERIRDKVRSIGLFPKKNRLVAFESMRSLGMRQMPIDNFLVFYLTDDEKKKVSVVRILYGKRNINELFE